MRTRARVGIMVEIRHVQAWRAQLRDGAKESKRIQRFQPWCLGDLDSHRHE